MLNTRPSGILLTLYLTFIFFVSSTISIDFIVRSNYKINKWTKVTNNENLKYIIKIKKNVVEAVTLIYYY